MSDRDTIFRQEALEYRAQGRDARGGVVRLGARWIRWSYRLTLLLVAAGVAATWLVRVDERASGAAVVDGRDGAVTALLPVAVAPDLPRSRELTVTLPGEHPRPVRVVVAHARLAREGDLRAAGLPTPQQPSLLLTGHVPAGALADAGGHPAHVATRATVVLRSETLAAALARQFRVILGHGGTGR